MRVDATLLVPVMKTGRYSDSETPDWSKPPSETPYKGCVLWPEQSGETPSSERPNHMVTSLALSLPYGAPVKSWHRVRVENGPYAGTWQVNGLPAQWSSPWEDWEPGCVVQLVEAEG